MSWRRFLVLVRGFGPNSATNNSEHAKQQPRRPVAGVGNEPMIVIDADKDPDAVDRLFAGFARGKSIPAIGSVKS